MDKRITHKYLTQTEYKKVWISIDVLCTIHFNACLQSDVQGAALEDNVIIIDKNSLLKSLATLSDVDFGLYDRATNSAIICEMK